MEEFKSVSNEDCSDSEAESKEVTQKYESDQRKYRSHCVESSLFNQNSDNMEKFKQLITISEQLKDLKSTSDTLRKEILQSMKNCKCARVICLESKKQLTISVARRSTRKEFDIEKFKREHPDLYEEYQIRVSSSGVGGSLMLRDITDKAYECYCNPENKQYLTT